MSLTDKYQHARPQPENPNFIFRDKIGLQDRIALGITAAVGTMGAVYLFTFAIGGWMLWQHFFCDQPFAPYPFAFLLFLGNIIQLLLMPLIMVGQNIQGRHAQIRSDENFKIATTSYRDLEHILKQVELLGQENLRQSRALQDLTGLLKTLKPNS